ncbi:hypothetical protein [Methanosphaera sp. WGK6]|uniref:hypothetical protein n=1 Tax=Methanosphaera sp. WGK6 TaxID=1561964 RepID=UPI00084C4B06|nr:hypothetical protein [Methanosphaera sp. WGK6]OED30347.1 hypothetical protein NL43_02925 [Methanosphaera sp. WGK6]
MNFKIIVNLFKRLGNVTLEECGIVREYTYNFIKEPIKYNEFWLYIDEQLFVYEHVHHIKLDIDLDNVYECSLYVSHDEKSELRNRIDLNLKNLDYIDMLQIYDKTNDFI